MGETPGVRGLPEAVRRCLEGSPEVGAREAAFLLLTMKDNGWPHVTLLSRAELDVDDGDVLIALAGRTTPANLDRTGLATLFVVDGDTAYSCELTVLERRSLEGMTGYRTAVAERRADSLGIPLTPITYLTPPELPSIERWETAARLLAQFATQ